MPDTHGVAAFAPITAAQITDEVWREVARRHEDHAPPPNTSAAPPPAPQVAPPAPSAALPLAALLALDSHAFVDAAYATVLGRAADPAGTAHLALELAAGADRIELLGRLQESPEAQRAGRPIPGLRKRYLARRLYRIPVIGPVAKLSAAVLRRTGFYRALHGHSRVDALAAARRFDALEAVVGELGRVREAAGTERYAAIDLATQRLAVLQAAHDDQRRKTLAATASHERQLAALGLQAERLSRSLDGAEDSLMDCLLAMADRLTTVEARLHGVEGCVDPDAIAGRIDAAAGSLRADLDGRASAVDTLAAQYRLQVADQQRQIGLMLHALQDRVPAAVEAEDVHALDGLYLQFEDRFRGTWAAVKERQRIYIPRLRTAGIGTAQRPILDIGAGRGEFLDLMREEGLAARGVDTNVAMATACQDAGLDCVVGDALIHLAAQPDGSLGAVTGFHIVEHLPFKVMVRIFDEALRAVSPGGYIIFETPNPANLLTASRYFYLDPTHRNPLPGEMMAMIAEARGFVEAQIVALHPMDARFPGNDRQLTEALDQIFHGPQDYALVARRP